MLKSNFKLKRYQQRINKYSNARFAFMCITCNKKFGDILSIFDRE